jgi:pyrroloquinoline quinone biosynthesis protein B
MAAHVRVLGTAQDGGFPHAGCGCLHCAAAHRDPGLGRRVASIAVVDDDGRTLLVDATPDLTAQVADLGEALGCNGPCLDGLLLTHAHIGHYVGLALLGREAMNASGLPVWATASMAAFLRGNRPWAHLVDRGQIVLQDLVPDRGFSFGGLRVTPFEAPHRAEDTDTVGVVVEGNSAKLLYLPDTDVWTDDLVRRIEGADVALVDGTFFDANELPHRNVSEIPHPFVRDSVRRLAGGETRVFFTHLNHTNPLLDPRPEGRPALPDGFAVLEEGATFPL